mgnify:CR=1 FL=1
MSDAVGMVTELGADFEPDLPSRVPMGSPVCGSSAPVAGSVDGSGAFGSGTGSTLVVVGTAFGSGNGSAPVVVGTAFGSGNGSASVAAGTTPAVSAGVAGVAKEPSVAGVANGVDGGG